MNVDALKLQSSMKMPGDNITERQQKSSSVLFEDFYKAAMGIYNDTNALQIEAEQLQVDFASGKSDDYLGMMIAQNKASTSLQFTVQVTNKVVEAYKEIMRIQI